MSEWVWQARSANFLLQQCRQKTEKTLNSGKIFQWLNEIVQVNGYIIYTLTGNEKNIYIKKIQRAAFRRPLW